MKLISSLEKLDSLVDVIVQEFDRSKHMMFAKAIMDMDEQLARLQATHNPAQFEEDNSYGKLSYEKYIDLLLDNNWRVFITTLNNQCINYIHAIPGKYKNSLYIGSFVVDKHFVGKGYGKRILTKFEKLIEHEYDILLLNVAIANKPAVKLYTADGFHPSHMTMVKKIKK